MTKTKRVARVRKVKLRKVQNEGSRLKRRMVILIDLHFVFCAAYAIFKLLSIGFDFFNYIEPYIGNKEFVEVHGILYRNLTIYYGYHIFQAIVSLFFLSIHKLQKEPIFIFKIGIVVLFQLFLKIVL